MSTWRCIRRARPLAAALACLTFVVAAQAASAQAAPAQAGAASSAATAPQLFAEVATLRDAGRLAEAQLVAERLVALVSARGEAAWEDQSVAWNTLGQIQYARGNYPSAVRSLAEVVRLRRRQPASDRGALAQAVLNLARATEANGDAAGAVPLFAEAVELFEQARGPSDPDVATATSLLGDAQLAAGDAAGAAASFQRVVDMREQAQAEAPAVLQAMRARARALSLAGRDEEASALLARAVGVAEAGVGPEHPELARTLFALGTLHLDRQRTDEAEPLLRRALTIAGAALGPTHEDTASVHAALGRLYQGAGRADQARVHYERALEVRRTTLGDRHPDVVRTLERLAVLRALSGDALGAVRDQEEALESGHYLHDLVRRSASAPRRLREAASLSEAVDAAVSLHLDRAPSSVAAARLALTSVLRGKGWLADAAARVDDAVAARLGADGAAKLEALRALQRELAATIVGGRGSRDVEAFAAHIARLEGQIAEAEAALARDYPGYRAPQPPATIDEVQARLSADTALVEFVVHRPRGVGAGNDVGREQQFRYVAYILPARGQVSWVDLGDAAAIDEAVVAFCEALRDPRRMDVVSYARRLDVMVLAPILGKAGQARHLVLSPDGLLDLVPFAALADRRGDYRLTQYLFSYVSSGRDLIPGVLRPARGPALVVTVAPDEVAAPARDAIPLQDGTGGDTREQRGAANASVADAVRTVLPDLQVAAGTDAAKKALDSAAGPVLVHVAAPVIVTAPVTAPAGAGDVASDRDSSRDRRVSRVAIDALPLVRLTFQDAGDSAGEAAAIADGDSAVMRGEGIAALDLDGAALCAFTAMEPEANGAGSANAVFAARRALVAAGCESQLLTLWQTDERAANAIVSTLYQQLGDRAARAEALRRAQQTVASTPRTQHPYYWAPFVLSGNWRGVDWR